MSKKYCEFCGKIQTIVEQMVNQCNECDPFEDADEMEFLFNDTEYYFED